MKRALAAGIAAVGLTLSLAACASEGDTTVIKTTVQQQEATAQGPKLGSGCGAEAVNTALMEVDTVRGPLSCSEASATLDYYFENVVNQGQGSGGGLAVAGWFCIVAPLGDDGDSAAGKCTERAGDRREFEFYSTGWAPRPNSVERECDYSADGGGIYAVQATGLDCAAALVMVGQYSNGGCVESASRALECRLEHGFRCRAESTSDYTGRVICQKGRQEAIFLSGD